MTKYIKFGIIAVCTFLFAGCVAGDFFDPSPEAIVMTGTDENPMIRFAVEDDAATYPVTVSATGPVSEDVKITLKIDNSLVEKYNQQYKTSYYSLPDNATSLEKSEVVIKKGNTASEASLFRLVSKDAFEDGRIYMVPVTITSTNGGGLEVLESSRTLYIRLATYMDFTALDLSDYWRYGEYIFEDSQKMELNTYTVEIKCYINEWHTSGSQISRLCAWKDKTESTQIMLRFGESGQGIDILQVVTPAGGIFTKTRFQPGNWYTISMTYDGIAFKLYVNGVLDSELLADCSTVFQRFEIGMAWGDNHRYNQRFLGRMAEVRVWDRALSLGEIQLGLCAVDPAGVEGLSAYWRFNEGEGHVFRDITGNGYDMDWSKAQSVPKEYGEMLPYDGSAFIEAGWVFDDKNKCLN